MRFPWSRRARAMETAPAGAAGAHLEALELRERVAELELQLARGGWTSGGLTSATVTRDTALAAARMGRALATLHPLVRNAVATQANYVFGGPLSVTSTDRRLRQFVSQWWRDPSNRQAVTSVVRLAELEMELQATGNVFLACWTDKDAGRVLIRPWYIEEVLRILTDPDDRAESWYYVRDAGDGSTRAYPALGHTPDPAELRRLGETSPLDTEARVIHLRSGGIAGSTWGLSDLVAAEPWAREVTADLTDYATVRKALASIVWRVSVRRKSPEAAAATVDAIAAKLRGTASTTDPIERNPPPTTGALWVSGAGAVPEAVSKAGAQPQTESGRRLWLMVGAALGLPETMLSGDVSTGNLATAKTLDRPTELKMIRRRALWSDAIERLGQYALLSQARAGALPPGYRVEIDDYARDEQVVTPEGDSVAIEVVWPPILEQDAPPRVEAIVRAATMGGTMPGETVIPLRVVQRLLLAALGVENVEEVLDAAEPAQDEEGKFEDAVRALSRSASALERAVR